jgi:hypothetical protein
MANTVIDKEHSGAIVIEFHPKTGEPIDQGKQDTLMRVMCGIIRNAMAKYGLERDCDIRLSIADITGVQTEVPDELTIRKTDKLTNFS